MYQSYLIFYLNSLQKSALLSVLEMLRSSHVEPKVRKSALVQVSVMLSDSSLHKTFISENGLSLILDIFSKALVKVLNIFLVENTFILLILYIFRLRKILSTTLIQ